MDLKTIYDQEGAAWLNKLHAATGIHRQYLYQCATGRRSPSPAYAMKLVQADPRLTLEGIYSQKVAA